MKNKRDGYQIVVFLVGEKGSGKTFIADRMTQKFGFGARISIAEVVRSMATDPGIFNVQAKYFEPEFKDQPFTYEIRIKEANIRRILSRLGEMLPAELNFRPSKIAISNFAMPAIKTPRELLQYIGFSVINKINHDYIPLLAYNKIVGVPGSFVVDDLRLRCEYDLAASKFQMVYSVLVESAKVKPKKDTSKDPYAKDEYDWREMETDFKISNPMVSAKIDQEILDVLTKIYADVDKKIEADIISPLGPTAVIQNEQWAASKGPLGQRMHESKTMQVGKAILSRGNTDDVALPRDKVVFYHDQGSVDRSGLRRG